MERTERKETTVTIAELVQQERVDSEAEAQEIVRRLQADGGSAQPETQISEILSSPEHQPETPLGIQILTNPLTLNEGGKGRVNDSKTWKDVADKRTGDRTSRRS